MRKFVEKVVPEKKEVILEDIICNKCEKSLKDRYSMDYEGLTNAEVYCEYGSILGDGNEYNFSLCETCLSELFDTFKIDPLFKDWMNG